MPQTQTRPISIKMPDDVLAHLRQVARWESFERNKDVTYSDLIREAVLMTYPMPVSENDVNSNEDNGS